MKYEETCPECKNTNGEHKPWYSRKSRHDEVPELPFGGNVEDDGFVTLYVTRAG